MIYRIFAINVYEQELGNETEKEKKNYLFTYNKGFATVRVIEEYKKENFFRFFPLQPKTRSNKQ